MPLCWGFLPQDEVGGTYVIWEDQIGGEGEEDHLSLTLWDANMHDLHTYRVGCC